MNRREFLSTSAGAACALAAIPAAAAESTTRLRVALIGCGPRGLSLAETAIRDGGCRITATFDAHPSPAQAAAARHSAIPYPTLRELLASASPDIAIVTGRADMAGVLELLRSRAHLLLDVVPSASLVETQALRKAAACSQAVQVNPARCGLADCPEAAALLRSVHMGRVDIVRAHVHHYHATTPRIDRAAELGWATEILAMSGEGSPRRVTATGHGQDQVVTWEFDGLTAIWEQRVFPGAPEERVSTGATWYGSTGMLRVNEDAWRFLPQGNAREVHGTMADGDRYAACWAELLRAMRERRQPLRNLELALSAAEMVRLAECSLKLERPLDWDGRRRLVVRDAEANRLLRSAPEWPA